MKARVICICTNCGAEFEKTKICRNTTEGMKWESWMKNNYIGVCSKCYQKEVNKEREEKYGKIRVKYSDYKKNYENCQTESGSYDKADKTIVVYVSRQYLMDREIGEIVYTKENRTLTIHIDENGIEAIAAIDGKIANITPLKPDKYDILIGNIESEGFARNVKETVDDTEKETTEEVKETVNATEEEVKELASAEEKAAEKEEKETSFVMNKGKHHIVFIVAETWFCTYGFKSNSRYKANSDGQLRDIEFLNDILTGLEEKGYTKG